MNAPSSKFVELVKTGSWLYDNQVLKSVWIIKQNWDYYYEGPEYTEGEPHLNKDGYAYYLVSDQFEDGRYAYRSETFYDIPEAMAVATNKFPSIKWKETNGT